MLLELLLEQFSSKFSVSFDPGTLELPAISYQPSTNCLLALECFTRNLPREDNIKHAGFKKKHYFYFDYIIDKYFEMIFSQ